MEDSFFGFDTSLPDDDGGGRIAEPSEEEYDALNDETFGSAINGDWEEAHESLVRMTDSNSDNGNDILDSGNETLAVKPKSKISNRDGATKLLGAIGNISHRIDSLADADLDLNLSGMKLDDVDINFDDSESNASSLTGVRVDSSVWGSSAPLSHYENAGSSRNNELNPANFLRQYFPLPFHQQQPMGDIPPSGTQRSNSAFGSPTHTIRPSTPKICTLEDIERNLIMQQALQKQRKDATEIQTAKSVQGMEIFRNAQHMQQFDAMKLQQSKAPILVQLQKNPAQQKGPPGFGPPPPKARTPNNFTNNMTQHPLGNLMQQSPPNGAARLPPGLPLPIPPNIHPHPFLNQHALPLNFPYPVPQHSLPSPHLPVALNNFAMHPNFNAMRAAGIHPAYRLPHPPNPPRIINQQPNAMFNMFSNRLVQEIQQNHPMLQNASRQSNSAFPQHQLLHQQQQIQQLQRNTPGMKQNPYRSANGNLPHEEIDEYANLMSTRDKHWLISIQLSQLNSDTPYIDDYYFTMYKKKKAAQAGVFRNSQAHKDNQRNHPLTQPKGHAQLILVQLGNKNGARNGQHRERHTSESSNISHNISGGIQDQRTPYVFTPLKFENSLGKLQYGSVTAPRKIIDAEIMGGDKCTLISENNENTVNSKGINSSTGMQLKNSNSNASMGTNVGSGGGGITDITMSAQRKSRHILLHIETLYRILLKLEDLENPNAILTIIMKKKKESERIAVLEQIENANKTPEEKAAETSNSQQTKQKFSYEIESKEVLIEKLIGGLTLDKIIAIMNVRKGKILLKRVLPFLSENNIRWQIWMGVFASLQSVVKKDPEDTDGVLYSLYPELKQQIQNANYETVVKLSKSLPINDKKLGSVFCNKFGIASLVCLIMRSEEIFVKGNDVTLNDTNKVDWRQFLDDVAKNLNRTIQSQTICAAIESDCIQPMMNHFARFEDLKLDSLLALVAEAKQQIN